MTVKELNQLYYLTKAIQIAKEQLAELRESADLHSPLLSDMPKASGARDKIGDIVPEIADQEEQIQVLLTELEQKRHEIFTYINTVPNVRIRLILNLRFVYLKSWQEVADAIGGNETEYTVKKTCYRFLKGRYS